MELIEEVKKHISDFLEHDVSHLTPDSLIASSLPGFDSLKMMEMVVYLEEVMHVEFDTDVVDKFKTLGDLVAYIEERKTAKAT
jgi:acyl carrier protein